MAATTAQKAKELVAQMTLEEKASLCSGQNFWQTKAVERLGVQSFMVTDGPPRTEKTGGFCRSPGAERRGSRYLLSHGGGHRLQL